MTEEEKAKGPLESADPNQTEFDYLNKRWEIARELSRHESSMSNQRYLRLFTATGFLLTAYSLSAREVTLTEADLSGRVLFPILLLIIALTGLAVTRSLLKEIDAAGIAEYQVHLWWLDLLRDRTENHNESAEEWFPYFRYTVDTGEESQHQIITAPFRDLRRVLQRVWQILVVVSLVVMAASLVHFIFTFGEPAQKESKLNGIEGLAALVLTLAFIALMNRVFASENDTNTGTSP